MAKPAYRSKGYIEGRRRLLGELCVHGCGRVAMTADHQPPLSLHEHVEGSGCCTLVPSCKRCSMEQGGAISRALALGLAAKVEVEVIEPAGFGPRDPIWDQAPWLKPLRRVPRDATWPRLMTAPHPKAKGTYGPEFVRWAQIWTGKKLRWFQKLIAYRMLEHDRLGRLVWEQIIVSMARQVGKSYLLRLLALWRMHATVRFGGDPQLVLHTASSLPIAREVIAPAQRWAQAQGDEYKCRFTNGELEIRRELDGSRWIVRANRSLVGYSAALAICDEAFDVPEQLVTEGLEPTTAAIENSQLLLVSTAHSQPKDLIPNRRMAALATLADPGVDLILEWSSPRNMDIWDRQGWRMASPHWTDRREGLIERKLRDAEAKGDGLEAVAAQWFCWWPPKAVPPVKGESLIVADLWFKAELLEDTEGPLVVAVEDNVGHGAAVAFCGQVSDGRWVVGGEVCENRAAAYQLANMAVSARDGCQLVVGASLSGDPALDELGVTVHRAGRGETPSALATLRDLLATGQAAQDGSPDLERQALACRVTVGGAGAMTLVAGGRTDLFRAAAWALQRATRDPVVAPAIHVA